MREENVLRSRFGWVLFAPHSLSCFPLPGRDRIPERHQAGLLQLLLPSGNPRAREVRKLPVPILGAASRHREYLLDLTKATFEIGLDGGRIRMLRAVGENDVGVIDLARN